MFVSSMTFAEIRQEMDKEKAALTNKIYAQLSNIAKVMRKTNMKTLDKEYEYISPRKNRWVYRVYRDASMKDDIKFDLYCQYYTERSYAVVVYYVDDDKLLYYTSHFFTRYFQREGLEREDIKDVIRTYISKAVKGAYQELKKLDNDVFQIFHQVPSGVALGYRHGKFKLFEFRTYISNSMLKGDQIERSYQLEEQFKLHVKRTTPGEGDTQSLSE